LDLDSSRQFKTWLHTAETTARAQTFPACHCHYKHGLPSTSVEYNGSVLQAAQHCQHHKKSVVSMLRCARHPVRVRQALHHVEQQARYKTTLLSSKTVVHAASSVARKPITV
jgi:hypothetical protein